MSISDVFEIRGGEYLSNERKCLFLPSYTGPPAKVQAWCRDGHNCCVGTMACDNWDGGSAYTIGENSCLGRSACNYLVTGDGPSTTKAATVEIRPGSCDGDRSCANLGRIDGSDVFVGTKSCRQADSCRAIGMQGEANVRIHSQACDGTSACQGIAQSLASKITTVEIEDRACRGNDRCKKCLWDNHIYMDKYRFPPDATGCSAAEKIGVEWDGTFTVSVPSVIAAKDCKVDQACEWYHDGCKNFCPCHAYTCQGGFPIYFNCKCKTLY